MPATSTVLIAFFLRFLLQPITVLMKQTRQPVRAVKPSVYLDVYGLWTVIDVVQLSFIIKERTFIAANLQGEFGRLPPGFEVGILC